ncbi:MAG: type I DNA topoisomerase [bacterium]|nr:type I DNA topoisomerase [bacterium]
MTATVAKKLLIVESPSKAKTIGKYLGSEYSVKASVGHIRDLPKSNKNAIDIEGGFVPHYEVVKKKEDVVEDIASAAGKASEIILATDPDREGEAIAWHLSELLEEKLGKKHPPITRAVYHEITKEAVEEALTHTREIDQNLRKAQEARRVLDRLVGYDLSGVIWKKIRYGLSAGRVQSPALRILAEREREISAFKPETFFVITAETETKRKEKLLLTCTEEPKTEAQVEKILTTAREGTWKVFSVSETKAKRSPKAPFITSTLQQAASTRLGFSPGRTMSIAQKLYEGGFITYMRTDSTNLAESAKKQIASVIERKFGKEMNAPRVYSGKVKNAQEAHEAIRPTDVSRESAGSTPEQKKLYELIWGRTVASQMPDAEMLRTKITAGVSDTTPLRLKSETPFIKGETTPAPTQSRGTPFVKGDFPDFTANGTRLLFPGWLLADPEARGEDTELPKVLQDEPLKLIAIGSEEKQTQPPPRYSEAGLIKELEKRGIGRPSTYATIVETLLGRGYVTKENRTLSVTDTGGVVSLFLETHFPSYISDTFTADMEDQLDDIAIGKREYTKTLRDFYTPFRKDVKSKDKLEKATNMGDAPEFKCPVCGGKVVWKLGRSGKFISCARFPDCTGALTAEGKVIEAPKETGEMCPKCTEGKLVLREGKFGSFIACSRYPKCKYIKEDPAEVERRKTGIACPTCAKEGRTGGEMVERRGRFGPFWSCANYPDCKNTTKTKPTGNLCPLCGSLYMLGTKTIPERCSSRTCPNHRPDKKEK